MVLIADRYVAHTLCVSLVSKHRNFDQQLLLVPEDDTRDDYDSRGRSEVQHASCGCKEAAQREREAASSQLRRN